MKSNILKLNKLSIGSKSKRTSRKKRLGRGPGSGFGKTSGRGHKGQKSRSGGKVRAGFEGGQMPFQQRIPKYGFSSRTNRFTKDLRLSALVSIDAKEVIDLEALKKNKVIKKYVRRVKVYKDTETCPKLMLKGLSTTRSVRSLIEESGGNVES